MFGLYVLLAIYILQVLLAFFAWREDLKSKIWVRIVSSFGLALIGMIQPAIPILMIQAIKRKYCEPRRA